MNSRSSFYDVKSFYDKKAQLKASYKGMRYQVEQAEDKAGQEDGKTVRKLRAYVWPEPFCFEKTPGKFKESCDFEYSEDGLDQAYKWICTCYDENLEKWEYAMNFPLDMAKEMGIM